MFNFKTRSILVPLFGLVAITMIGMILSVGTAVYFIEKAKTEDKIAQARSLVEAARGILSTYAEKVKAGSIDEKTAQEYAKQAVRGMHYGDHGSEYFFIYDDKGVAIAHGSKPEIEGQNRIDSADAQGFKYVPALIEAAKRGGDSLYYSFPKLNATVPSRKVSYAVYYEPWNWVIGTGLYIDDIQAEVWDIVKQLSVIVLGVIAIAASIAFLIARGIATPVKALANTAKHMSKGNYDVEVPALDRADEIGALARAIDVLRGEASATDRMRQEQEQSEIKAQEDRRRIMLQLATDFESSVIGAVKMIVSAVHDNDTASKSLTGLANKASDEATQVAATVDEANRNVQVIAAAAEQLLASIREISSQVQHANGVASQAVAKAVETDQIVKSLSEAVGRITDVVGLIGDVASQTNLLALNATIEAARAGEAGKGFAVVAGEVKSLATQTAKATDEIISQIESVKAATGHAIAAIKDISVTISSVSEVSTSIAAAVEEQSAATNEIARNVSKAAQGVDSVTGFVTRLAGITTEVKSGVGLVSEVTASLSGQSGLLDQEVKKFIAHIKG